MAMVEELRFDGSIREVTVRTAGTWFACFCTRTVRTPPVKDGPAVGVDVGVGTMAVCSDGAIVENPKALSVGLKRLRRLDKAIARSRNVHGKSSHSNRRERLYAKRRNVHARVVNVRNDNHHKATTAIAKSAGRVVVPCVSGMVRNRRLPGDQRRRDVWLSQQAGVRASGTAPSLWRPGGSRHRSCVLTVAGRTDLTLSHREWWCGGCGVLNEDANAANNLANWPGLSFPVSGRGDCVRPAAPAVVGETSTDETLALTMPVVRAG